MQENVREQIRVLLRSFFLSALSLLLAGCSSDSTGNSLGDAYVAPASLNLHSSLAAKSNTVAVLHHGEHLTVVDVKRRYVKVRTAKDAEGWVDSRQLLSKAQMDQLTKDTQSELRLPSQGRATAFDILNVHIDPDRRSPAFAQISAGGSVDVIAHKAVPKASGAEPVSAPSFIRPPATVTTKRARHSKASKAVSLRPPMPNAPKPPADWQLLSSERINGPTAVDLAKQRTQEEAKKKAEASAKPVVLEDWSLIRTKEHVVGWVLARNLYMAIPDEVAQYAEGQRISAYFELGSVDDEEKGVKHSWLWTTSSMPQPFDFDRLRIFYWNRRRHRYETSFRQKDLTGFFPVDLEPATPGEPQRRFSLILQDDDGKFWKKHYVFDGTLTHLTAAEAYQPPAEAGPTKAAPLAVEQMEAKRPQPNWLRRRFDRLRRLWRK